MSPLNGKVASEPIASLASSPRNDPNTISPTALQTTLQKLISSTPADLVPVLRDLSALTKRIEASSDNVFLLLSYISIQQTPANVQALGELVALLEDLRPTVAELAERKTSQGQTFVEHLERELQLLIEDLEAAWSQGRLDDFFSAANSTSSFVKHKLALAQTIADCAGVMVNEALGSVRGVGGLKLHYLSSSGAPIMSGDVTGGIGGTGGTARIGGEGGEGGGPQLDLDPNERYKISNVSGGTGGTGGVGVEVGGKGGTGMGPVISTLRRGRT
ncbi:hypothetical protein DFH08DRAFT_1028538 [Mycena albidolilacea]|uniref:Uncharacterized protein n=1 Tax=Mycena albidolilacea TaxID=1033008 RepID=A0AAD6ZJN1_9AGAR|nr:hypothetical protein DFH08DRAFT_1028538 [Mycena albidolilacea]